VIIQKSTDFFRYIGALKKNNVNAQKNAVFSINAGVGNRACVMMLFPRWQQMTMKPLLFLVLFHCFIFVRLILLKNWIIT